MPRFLLDTNICIYIRQQRPVAALERFKTRSLGETAMSVVTYGELARGVEKSRNAETGMHALQELASLIPVLALPVEAGAFYGSIRAALERRGEIIGGNDLWIAAHARAAGLVLVTNNEREFTRIPDLRVENWAR